MRTPEPNRSTELSAVPPEEGSVAENQDDHPDDDWTSAEAYSARLGGVVYRNIGNPIVVNDEPVITLHRHRESGRLAPTFELLSAGKQRIARVLYGVVYDLNEDEYQLLAGDWGLSIIERRTGRVWCDVRVSPVTAEHELDCSCLLLTKWGYPVVLHPDRTLLGKFNTGEPPRASGFTITTESPGEGCAIAVEGTWSAIDIAIENFRTGIEVTYNVS